MIETRTAAIATFLGERANQRTENDQKRRRQNKRRATSKTKTIERDATVMDDGAPTGPKTILRYFPERFRHHHADRIRHVRRPNTNKRTLAIRWRLGLTVCVWMCSHLLVCVRTCA